MKESLASMPEVLVCLLVCLSKIIEISIQSVKTVMLVKGEKLKAACLGFTECMIWGLVISSVISTLGDNLFLLFFYCFGYAVGLFVGSTLENRIALGTSTVQLIANEEDTEKIKELLKEKGKGYTTFKGKGAKEKMNMFWIVVPRKEARKLIFEINNLCDNQVFAATSDVSGFAGGYGIRK